MITNQHVYMKRIIQVNNIGKHNLLLRAKISREYKYLLDKYKHFEGKRVVVKKNNTVELLDKLDELKITESWMGAPKIGHEKVLYIAEVDVRKTNQWTPFLKKWRVSFYLSRTMKLDEYEEAFDHLEILDKELEKILIKENLLPANKQL